MTSGLTQHARAEGIEVCFPCRLGKDRAEADDTSDLHDSSYHMYSQPCPMIVEKTVKETLGTRLDWAACAGWRAGQNDIVFACQNRLPKNKAVPVLTKYKYNWALNIFAEWLRLRLF